MEDGGEQRWGFHGWGPGSKHACWQRKRGAPWSRICQISYVGIGLVAERFSLWKGLWALREPGCVIRLLLAIGGPKTFKSNMKNNLCAAYNWFATFYCVYNIKLGKYNGNHWNGNTTTEILTKYSKATFFFFFKSMLSPSSIFKLSLFGDFFLTNLDICDYLSCIMCILFCYFIILFLFYFI